jgi:hypothetical protein
MWIDDDYDDDDDNDELEESLLNDELVRRVKNIISMQSK